jgi:hypothetical protein
MPDVAVPPDWHEPPEAEMPFLPPPTDWESNGQQSLPEPWQVVVKHPYAAESRTVEISVVKVPARVRDGSNYVFLTAEGDAVHELPVTTVRSIAKVENVSDLVAALQRAVELR